MKNKLVKNHLDHSPSISSSDSLHDYFFLMFVHTGQELKDLYEDEEMRHSLRYLEAESVRPQMKMTDIR